MTSSDMRNNTAERTTNTIPSTPDVKKPSIPGTPSTHGGELAEWGAAGVAARDEVEGRVRVAGSRDGHGTGVGRNSVGALAATAGQRSQIGRERAAGLADGRVRERVAGFGVGNEKEERRVVAALGGAAGVAGRRAEEDGEGEGEGGQEAHGAILSRTPHLRSIWALPDLVGKRGGSP